MPHVWPPFLSPEGGFGGFGGEAGPGAEQQAQPGSITASPGSPKQISTIVDSVDNAIVDINVTFTYQHAAGAGTGIVLTSDGEVLTNNHVINGATSIAVTDLGNGETYSATVLGYDPRKDVALLQLTGASGLTTADLGDSSTLTMGNPVVGIGNAGGVGGSPSAAGGKVIGLEKSIAVGDEMYGTTAHLTGLIETNAAIAPGDSGGPLVTPDGDVIGMDTAASAGRAATASGHDGYAIPINTALAVAKQIDAGHGTSQIHVGPTAALGVLVRSGVANAGGNAGAIVAGVVADGAAAQIGLRVGDVITSFDGHTIASAMDLTTLMLAYRPGQKVRIGWMGPGGKAHHASATLGRGPAS